MERAERKGGGEQRLILATIRGQSVPATLGILRRDERVRAALYAHIDRLLDRVNTGNGVRYADDPTIFGWEIMNESQVNSDAGAEARREFITEVAAHIRARDPQVRPPPPARPRATA